MSSETDSSSSSLSELEKKLKLQKKLKKKSEKKSKKHKKEKKKKSRKEKKRSHKEYTTLNDENPQINMTRTPFQHETIANDDNRADVFGPALPPHLLNKTNNIDISEPLVIGPVIPKEILGLETEKVPTHETKYSVNSEKSDGEDMRESYGPLPVTNEREMTTSQIELEQRALKLKMAAIDGTHNIASDQTVREEWMLELPDVGLKGGLAALNNLKRGFHQGKEKPDFSDRSSWTKTPQIDNDKQKPNTSSNYKKQLEQQARNLYEKQRDADQEAIAKKYEKKQKLQGSLVEIHQKKLRREEKKKAKKLEEIGIKPGRRPFTRDIDLKLNKIDRNQTKQIVEKAKILNTKFSTGHSKYL